MNANTNPQLKRLVADTKALVMASNIQVIVPMAQPQRRALMEPAARGDFDVVFIDHLIQL